MTDLIAGPATKQSCSIVDPDTSTFLTAAACFRYCHRKIFYHPSAAIKEEEEEDADDVDVFRLGILTSSNFNLRFDDFDQRRNCGFRCLIVVP